MCLIGQNNIRFADYNSTTLCSVFKMRYQLGDKVGNMSSAHQYGQAMHPGIGWGGIFTSVAVECASIVLVCSSATEANHWFFIRFCRASPVVRGWLCRPLSIRVCRWLWNMLWTAIDLKVCRVDAQGVVDLDLSALVTSDTVLISVILAGNEIGTIQPLSAVYGWLNRWEHWCIRMWCKRWENSRLIWTHWNWMRYQCRHASVMPLWDVGCWWWRCVCGAPCFWVVHSSRAFVLVRSMFWGAFVFGSGVLLFDAWNSGGCSWLGEGIVPWFVGGWVGGAVIWYGVVEYGVVAVHGQLGHDVMMRLDMAGVMVSTGSAWPAVAIDVSPVITALGRSGWMPSPWFAWVLGIYHSKWVGFVRHALINASIKLVEFVGNSIAWWGLFHGVLLI